jgi:penicillin-binding protein 2
MLILDQLNRGERPLRILAWGLVAGFLVLLGGLWRVQIVSGERYRIRQETQSYRTVRLPAMRGRILDRNGLAFAENQPRYRLDVYLDELLPQFADKEKQLRRDLLASRGVVSSNTLTLWDRISARFSRQPKRVVITATEREWLKRQARFSVVSNVIAEVNHRLGVAVVKTEQDLYTHWSRQRALPFPILNKLTPAQVAVLTEQGWSIPGVELELVPVRHYPHGSLGAHIIGAVRPHDSSADDDQAFDYRLRDYRGLIGLESAYDRQLRGSPGAKSILINSSGYRHRQGEILLAEPVIGQTLVTTLDLGLQRAVERSLALVGGDERGAVVVLDSRNGDILASASAPAFEPNDWIDGISHEEYARLLDPKMKYLFNRATYGSYNPGSTFKIVTALACFENGILTTENVHDRMRTLGYYRIGRNHTINDTASAGEYDFNRAFIKSSNAYFIEHALRLGIRPLLDYARRLHLGEKPGLRLHEEATGEIPAAEDVPAGGIQGKTANLSIGQELTLTPVQLALVVASVANGGSLFWPRLVDRIEPSDPLADTPTDYIRPGQVRTQLNIRREHLDILRAAMRDDVALEEGTGKAARVKDFLVCGKTGTAEIKAGRRLIDKITWFASFGPYESPRYVVVVMIESGGSGGGTCAPVARRIYEYLRDRERGAGNLGQN